MGIPARRAGLAGRAGPGSRAPDLPLRIRVAVSQERARSAGMSSPAGTWPGKTPWVRFCCRPARAFASAVLLLGTVILLITMFAKPESAQATPDEPLGNATAPRLLYFSNAPGNNEMGAISGPVVVEVYVNGARARSTTSASLPDPAMTRPAPMWRTCFCSAASRRPASSASPFAALPCFPSPASPCAGKGRRTIAFRRWRA